MDVLFPETEVHGVKVKPWTLGQFVSLIPDLNNVKKALQAENITLETIEEQMLDIVTIVAPVIPSVLKKSLPLSPEQVDALPMEKWVDLLMAVISKNLDSIKNFSGPKAAEMKSLADMAKSFGP